jgi:hypothetical protein
MTQTEDRRQLRLDLDNESNPGCRSDGKDVDRTALAVFRERDLDVDVPPMVSELVRHPAD